MFLLQVFKAFVFSESACLAELDSVVDPVHTPKSFSIIFLHFFDIVVGIISTADSRVP